jgi:hypothetical protein
MAQELPVVCSLGASDLGRRLAAIGEIGAESLIDHQQDGGRHLLRFRSDTRTRERLEDIVKAERECCAFLDLTLMEGCCELTLKVTAPEAGQATADGFAMAFVAGGPASTR